MGKKSWEGRGAHTEKKIVLPWNFRGHTDPGQYY